MTDENVLIVQADSAETSLASARLGTRRRVWLLGAGGGSRQTVWIETLW